MSNNKIQLITEVHPMGGVVVHYQEDGGNSRRETGDTFRSFGEFLGHCSLNGLTLETDVRKHGQQPRTESWSIDTTPELLGSLGFHQVGARL